MKEEEQKSPFEAFLTEEDPPIFTHYRALKNSPFFMVSDHAGRAIPKNLGDMGVSFLDWQRHIAYDIGIAGIGDYLHHALGASLIEQNYSRLVIDCNRAPGHPTSIPPLSDGTLIEANRGLSQKERRKREEAILRPYHDFIEEELEIFFHERGDEGGVFITLHSFTPEMNAQKRPWHIGILYEHDPESAQIMRRLLEKENLIIGDNEPYILTSQNEYTLPFHAASRGMAALEIEIRQDLITDEAGQKKWGDILGRLLPQFWAIKQEKRLKESEKRR